MARRAGREGAPGRPERAQCRLPRVALGLLAALATLAGGSEAAVAQQGSHDGPDPAAPVAARVASPPAVFVPERDAAGEIIGFRSRHAGTPVRITNRGIDVLFVREDGGEPGGRLVRIRFPGSREDSVLEAVGSAGSAQGRAHTLVGRDPTAWSHEECSSGVTFRQLHPGLDLSVSVERRALAFRLDTGPGGDLAAFRMRVETGGADDPAIADTTRSDLSFAGGLLRITAPGGGVTTPTTGSGSAGWTVVERDLALPQADAAGGTGGVEWSTYFGGSGIDAMFAVARQPDGRLTVTGRTKSVDFPTTPGVFQTTWMGSDDVFVSRFDPTASTLEYSTLLGGAASADRGVRLALVGADVIVAGFTGSTDFPTTPGAYDESATLGASTSFVTRLSADGSRLVYSTILGDGDEIDRVAGLALAPNGDVVVAGRTSSGNYPTTPGALQPTDPNGPGFDFSGYVSRLDSTGSTLLASTYLGGSDYDQVEDVLVEADGSVVVIGRARSLDLPVTPGVLGPTINGIWDAFVARLSPDLSSLDFLTYLGGSSIDFGYGIASGPEGELVVVGETQGTGFPTTPGAFDPVGHGTSITDLFVARLSHDGREVLYGTYVGGGGTEDAPLDLHVDSAGAVTVLAQTRSNTFPTTPGAFQETPGNPFASQDQVVFRLHPSGGSILYSTYLGGSLDEINMDETGLAVAPDGSVVATSTTLSSDFPGVGPGAFDPTLDGASDGTITFLGMLPAGVVRYGVSTTAGGPPLTLGVNAQPQVGQHGFGITCTNAPPAALGYLLLAGAPLPSPVPVAGADAWIDPTTLLLVRRPLSNPLGWSERRLGIPAMPALAGTTVYAQEFWPAGDGSGTFLASDALAITIQP